MKITITKISAVVFSVILVLLVSFSVCAFDSDSALDFKISADGFATVSDCDEGAHGVIIIPESVTIGEKTYAVKYIGEKAFESCYSVTEIRIPEGVTAIKNFAFRDCISLKNVYIPESLVMCQYDAFEGCSKLTVHCYRSNYQFFTVYGIASNIDIVVIDADEDSAQDNEATEDSAQPTDLISRIVQAIRNLINRLTEYFSADDEEIELPFLPDIPFLDEIIKEF